MLPPYARLIVDEAHHLEDEATRQFGFVSGERAISEMLDRCESLRGRCRRGCGRCSRRSGRTRS